MITDRLITLDDKPVLADSLLKDAYHNSTPASFFYTPGTVSKVYEDGEGIVMFVRGAKVLRLDIQYTSNADKKRNLRAMLEFDKLVEKAKTNGFTEITFTTNSDLLKKFCIKHFGFVEECKSCGELRKYI